MAALNAGCEANDREARIGSSRDVKGHVSCAKRDARARDSSQRPVVRLVSRTRQTPESDQDEAVSLPLPRRQQTQ
jgi:hypothetical protein